LNCIIAPNLVATKREYVSTIKNKHIELQSNPPSLLRNRDYLLLLSGQVISSVGTQASQLAFPLLILALTKSPAQAGLAGALRVLPYIIFSLPAGALVDRWDRKRVMILCNIGRGLCLVSIPIALYFGRLTVGQIYLVSLIEGTLFVFFNIAEVACLPHVVPKEQLPAATAQNIVTNSTSSLLGPPIGGLLYSFGRALPFLVDSISYLISVVALLFIKTNFQERRQVSSRKLWIEIQEGFKWLWHQPLIIFIAWSGMTVHLVGSGLILTIIVLAQHQQASSFSIGLLLACSGFGSILGAFIGPFFQKRFRFGQVIIATECFWIVLWPLYAIAPNVLWLGVISIAMFMSDTIYDIMQFSYRLSMIPGELQGRINSIFRLIAFAGDPIGLTLAGLLLQALGPVWTVLLLWPIVIVLTIVTAFNSHVRNARPFLAGTR
jgi:predicted MFS family arabinose efflux permease